MQCSVFHDKRLGICHVQFCHDKRLGMYNVQFCHDKRLGICHVQLFMTSGLAYAMFSFAMTSGSAYAMFSFVITSGFAVCRGIIIMVTTSDFQSGRLGSSPCRDHYSMRLDRDTGLIRAFIPPG